SFFDFLNQLKKELRIPARTELAPHTLRRCFATYNTLAGMPLNILQRILGHSKISTTALYIKDSDLKKDQELLLRALANSNVIYFDYEFARLESGETLLNHLCQIVAESFSEAQSLGIVSTHREVKEGSCGLARRQLFTNGNKRTALLTVRNFVYECGYRLLDTGFSEKELQNLRESREQLKQKIHQAMKNSPQRSLLIGEGIKEARKNKTILEAAKRLADK
ncbi:39109_t:CDS:2, partial [Gigaspora margarita]